jgi:hypothetical protein
VEALENEQLSVEEYIRGNLHSKVVSARNLQSYQNLNTEKELKAYEAGQDTSV